MNAEQVSNVARVACITVTFNPDIEILRKQFAALPVSSPKVIVDNASESGRAKEIEELVAATPNAALLRNSKNLGLAAAINKGVDLAHADWPGAQFVLLLDQDSEPHPGSISELLEAFQSLQARGVPVGCVGPTLIDAETGLQHGFHQCTRWRWKRVYPEDASREPVKCANLNGSGTLVPVELFLQLGGLEPQLFIDHVDTEWAFRVQAAGWDLYGIPNITFVHRMGAESKRIWFFGWRVWPSRSPRRHYFLFRNALILMRRTYVPRVWKIWAAAKLLLTASVSAVAGPSRRAQITSIYRGVIDGMRSSELGNS